MSGDWVRVERITSLLIKGRKSVEIHELDSCTDSLKLQGS